jgi:hypothetical protein
MRKLIAVGALVAALAGFAPVASAAQAIPTCLIDNGGGGGRFTKTLLCVELLNEPRGHAASGSYSPGDPTAPHWLTVSLQYRPPGPTSKVWLPLATVTTRGRGQLKAVTRTVVLPAPGSLRACTQVGGGRTSVLCSAPN